MNCLGDRVFKRPGGVTVSPGSPKDAETQAKGGSPAGIDRLVGLSLSGWDMHRSLKDTELLAGVVGSTKGARE